MKKRRTLFKSGPSRLSLVLTYVGLFLWLLAIVIVTVPFWPHFWYRLKPVTSQELSEVLAQEVYSGGFEELVREKETGEIYQPPFDPNLPEEKMIRIQKIGVYTMIREAEDASLVLKKGVWRVPNFGTPEKQERPVILAAHRFGYIEWSQEFRARNSFYNLPKLKVGDEVKIIWNQRKYVYKIDYFSEGKQITDYDTDLILYTCKLFNSPLRIFYFASLTPET